MGITTDFNIFADKYHGREHLPRDIIKMIMDINTERIRVEINHTKLLNLINEIEIYDDDGDNSIYEMVSGQYNDGGEVCEYVFEHPLSIRVFDVLHGMNIEPCVVPEIDDHDFYVTCIQTNNVAKLGKDTFNRCQEFYEMFMTLHTHLERHHQEEEYYEDYKRLYPENFIRHWCGYTGCGNAVWS